MTFEAVEDEVQTKREFVAEVIPIHQDMLGGKCTQVGVASRDLGVDNRAHRLADGLGPGEGQRRLLNGKAVDEGIDHRAHMADGCPGQAGDAQGFNGPVVVQQGGRAG